MARSSNYESSVVTVSPEASCIEIADEMDAHGVGCVVVEGGGAPIGIVTDRDLVCRVLSPGLDAEKTTAKDIMSENLACAHRADDIEEILETMRKRGIRRIPLVAEGKTAGIVSLDDLLSQVSSYVYNLSCGVRAGLNESQRKTRTRRRQEAREDALEEIRSQLNDFGDSVRDRVKSDVESILERLSRRS